MPAAVLEREMQTYQQHKADLVAKSLNKFALIVGSEVMGTWDTYGDALQAGYSLCGLDREFMVKQVREIEQVHVIYRGTAS